MIVSQILAWSDSLPSARLQRARSLLGNPNIQLDSRTTKFLSSMEGMNLVAEAHSSIFRSRDDQTDLAAAISDAPFTDPVSQDIYSTATPDGLKAVEELIRSAE